MNETTDTTNGQPATLGQALALAASYVPLAGTIESAGAAALGAVESVGAAVVQAVEHPITTIENAAGAVVTDVERGAAAVRVELEDLVAKVRTYFHSTNAGHLEDALVAIANRVQAMEATVADLRAFVGK